MKTNKLANSCRSEEQARMQLESIVEMADALEKADEGGSDDERDEARTTIIEDALSVQVRGGWYCPGNSHEGAAPEEFEILLCTGGPAVRIIGDLDGHCSPVNPRIEHQDWGTPWTELRGISDKELDALRAYCETFYFSPS